MVRGFEFYPCQSGSVMGGSEGSVAGRAVTFLMESNSVSLLKGFATKS